jgi:zinc protease
MFGSGGIGNRISRLYQDLIESQLAASVYGLLSATIDPGIYSVHVTCRKDHNPEEVLSALNQTVDSLLQAPAAPEALAVALKQAKANFAYSCDNITNQGFWMGFSESFADYSWFSEYVDRLAGVSAEDVLRVARKYLDPQKRITGIYRGQHD